MDRVIAAVVLSLILLGGCEDRNGLATTEVVHAPMQVETLHDSASLEQQKANLAYSHQLEVEIASDRLIARFTQAHDLCLTDKALGCTLLNTAVNSDASHYYTPVARLTVRLPHDGVVKFEQAILAPVGKGRRGLVKVRSRSTNAEDLSVSITDVGRRLAQLMDYRERLTQLAKRNDTRAEELIKIESELANTQKQIEDLTAEQRGLNRRVETELLTVEFFRAPTLGTAWEPIGSAFTNAGQTLGENVGEAVRFGIAALPFIPLIGIGFAVAALGWRLFRRIQGRPPAVQDKSPPHP